MTTPTNECIPLFRGGHPDLTGHTTAAVVGGTFAVISGNIQSGPGLVTDANGGNIQVATAPAGAKVLGVFGYDQASGAKVAILRKGNVVPMTANGTITAGDPIQVGTSGNPKSGASPTAAAATATTGVVGSNNALTYTAVDSGAAGNGISVRILGSTGNSVSLSVAATGNDIVVTPATDSGGVITSTATLVAAAIAASGAAHSLVTVANTLTSTGAGLVAAVGPINLTGGSEGNFVGTAYTTAADGAVVYVEL